MPVRVQTQGAPRGGPSAATLAHRARRMLAALRLERAELSLVLCDDRTIHALNREHRGIDRPTDVLAFAQSEGRAMPAASETHLLGDVVISLPTVRRQARAAGHSALAEATMLLAHGLLHLLGFDHQTVREERRMRARTDALIAAARPRATGRRRLLSAPKRHPRRAV